MIMKFFLYLLAVLGGLLWGQEYRSTISGQITDPTGAGVPRATIVASEAATGNRFETQSDEVGNYTLPFLPPGQYTITVEAPGFKRYVRGGYTVSTNQRLILNAQMEVGQLTDTVTVTAEAPVVVTGTASVGQVITSNQVENMPLNGRTPLTLAQLAYGVTPTSDPRFQRPFDNAGPSDFSMGGGQNRSNELLIDGSPDMTGNRRVAYNPPVDTVTEVKVESFQADAAYGNTAGGTVNVVLRGGSNEFHGTVYEFNQVSRLAATPFFTNRQGSRKSVTRYNQYGVTAGGPVWIPRVWDGRNRLFWYLAFEGIQDSFPEPVTTTVPTEAMRRGDFSELLRAGSQYQLYDPGTGILEGSRIRRQPLPNNIIPENRLSPIAKAYLQFYPMPNQPGRADSLNNYLANSVRSDDFVNYLGRLDWNASERHKLFWNFRHNDRLENRGNLFNNLATGNFLSRVNWGSTLDDVYTFTPTLVLNTRLNWTRFIEGSQRPSDGFDFTRLGFPQQLLAASSRRVLPQIDLDQHQDLGDSGGDRTPYDSFQAFSSMTKVAGPHSVKFGADLRELRESSASFGASSGSYRFDSSWTRGPLDNSPAAPLGQSLAAFLLGLPTGGAFDINATRTNHSRYYAFFVQDDWRVSQSLTVNIGLRYERETGTVERFDRTLVGFDFSSPNAVTERAKAAYAANPSPLLPPAQFHPVGGVIFASPQRRNVYSTEPHAFSPRIGLAWAPRAWGGKMVFRGGYGIFYDTIGTTGIQQPGFSARTPLVATLDSFLTPAATLSNPFPNGLQRPVGSALGINTFLGQSVSYFNPNQGQPYTNRWNFNIQREVARNLVLEVGYMGSNQHHLRVDRDLNFVPARYLSTSLTRDQETIDRLTAIVANPFAGLLPGTALNGSTLAVENLLRRFPQFSGSGGVRILGYNEGSANYHSLQVRLERRYANGLQLLANYQFSKMLERTRPRNPQDDVLEYRIADEDRTHRVVVSGNYELPFGRGRRFGTKSGQGLNLLIGGWVINAIWIAQSGAPLNFEGVNAIYWGGDWKLNAHNVDGAFDVTVLERDPRRQLDRNIRYFPTRFGNLRADAVRNLDASIIKNFTLSERLTAQLRGEFFNAMNHPIFNAPQLNPTASDFGRINSQANLPRITQLGLRLRW